MISAHTTHNAAPGRPAHRALARLARAALLACALGAAGLGTAQAQHGRGQFRGEPIPQDARDQFPAPRDEGNRVEPRFDPRSFDSREFDDVRARRQQMQQMQQEQNARNADVRRSRMTPDERRDLRRQINEAGMDLYQKPPPPPPPRR